MKRLMIVTAAFGAMALTGCGSMGQTRVADAPLKSPTPEVTRDQTMASQGRVENTQTIDLPSWYIKAPASTDDYVFIAGTAVSSDLSMSRQKALLDAQVQLADKLNGMVNALVKQNRKDDSGTMGTDRTQLIVKKVIVDTALTGMHLEDTRVVAENRGYRTFVLVRYPVGDANRLLKDKRQQERQEREDATDAGQNDLEKELDARRKPVSQAPVETRPVAAGTVQLMPVDNEEYKARRDAALQKPGAVIGQTVVR